jgi:thiol-disulfide isomerase/thioredoxin
MKNVLLTTVIVIGLAACAAPVDPDSGLKPAPQFDLAAFPEGTFNSADLEGKIVIVDFWATWCVPCIKEIPDLNEIYHAQDPETFAMIGITIQSGSHEDIEPYIEELGIEYPILVGDEDVVAGFGGVIGFPTKFVVGPDGTIYKKYLGGEVKEKLEQDILDLRGGGDLAQAF